MRAGAGKKAAWIAGFTLGVTCLSGCGTVFDMPVGSPEAVNEAQTVTEDAGRYEITDTDREIAGSNVTQIDLEDLSGDGNGRYFYEDGRLFISDAGDYVLRGTLDGGVVIDVFEDEIVHLVLDNVDIRPERGAAVWVEKAAKVIITAREDTENVLSDGAGYDGRYRACIFSNSDLTINGAGVLSVYGYHGDGVRSKDQVKVVNADLYVRAKGEGIRGNDGVILTDSRAEVECEGNGLLSASEKDMVIIQGGSCKIIAGKSAVVANRYVSVRGSQTDLYSVLEAIKCDGIREVDGELPE